MDLITLAFSLVGFVVGLIFVLDGWKSSNEDHNTPLSRTPRIRGFVFVISASFISGLVLWANRSSDRIAIYVISLVVGILISLLAMCMYAVLVAYSRYRPFKANVPRRIVFIEAVEVVGIVLQGGLQSFRAELNNHVATQLREENRNTILRIIEGYDAKISELDYEKKHTEQILENIIDFIFGFLASVSREAQRPRHIKRFRRLIEQTLKLYLILFFEQQDYLEPIRVLRNYRACLYYHDIERREFRYFLGVSPRGVSHSGRALPIKGSALGWALRNPNKPHKYPGEISEEEFYTRENEQPYASVITCTLSSLLVNSSPGKVELVLSIDCVYDTPSSQKTAYLKARTKELANLLSYTQAILRIEASLIKKWLNK